MTLLEDQTVTTLEQAYESFKPQQVKDAIDEGWQVKRQGEWYFIPVNRSKPNSIGLCIPIDKPFKLDKGLTGYGRTAHHTVSEGFTYKDKVYVRGIVKHDLKDHAPVKLYEDPKDKIWYEAVKNKQILSWSDSVNKVD